MELKQLATIQAILEQGSFQKAADRLGYVQSTITLHIRQLEEELGFRLFRKDGRRMLLSREGEFFWAEARPLLRQAGAVKEAMSGLALGRTGHARIGTIATAGRCRLVPLLLAFRQEHPDMRLTLEFGVTDSLSQALARDRLDMALCPAPPDGLDLLFEPLFLEPMRLLLPSAHPLAAREALSLADLAGVEVLLSEPLCSYRAEVQQHLIAAGVRPRTLIQINDAGAMVDFVRAGAACAFLPAPALDPLPEGTVSLDLADAELGLRIGLVRRPEPLGKLAGELRARIISVLGS